MKTNVVVVVVDGESAVSKTRFFWGVNFVVALYVTFYPINLFF